MDLIDDEGNFFDLINIIDALAILVVFAVVVAGAAFVFQSDSETPTTTTNVTLDVGVQPTYIATAITQGDTYSANSESRLTVTDIYRTPDDGRTRVILRAEVTAPAAADGGLTCANASLRLGGRSTSPRIAIK